MCSGAGSRPIAAKSGSSAVLKRNRLFECVALTLYIALGVVMVLYHEAWSDEADTWLIARDAPLAQWPALLGRAGVPALWYIVLLPFARAGLPYVVQPILHLLIASAAAALVLFRSPFSRPLKLLIVFSYYLGYEYVAVARPYALMILLLFTLAVLYETADLQPVTFAVAFALFVNTTVHALLIGAAIGPVLAWRLLRQRTARVWSALAIMIGAGVIAGLPMALAAGRLMKTPFGQHVRLRRTLNAVSFAFAPLFGTTMAGAAWGLPLIFLPIVIFVAASLVIGRDRAALLILWLSWAALLFIIIFVHWDGLRHSGLLLMALLFSLWIAREAQPRRPAALLLKVSLYGSLVVSLVFAARVWRLEVLYPFSGAKDAAAFLLAHHLEDRPIAAHGEPESVLAYLPRRQLWYPAINGYGSYINWDISISTDWATLPANTAAIRALQKFPTSRDLLIMTNEPLTIAPQYGLHVLCDQGSRVREWLRSFLLDLRSRTGAAVAFSCCGTGLPPCRRRPARRGWPESPGSTC